jgi:hypothetical protein
MVARVTTMEGIPRNATKAPLKAPMITPHRTATIPTTGVGQPLLAARPAKTLQRANCEPMEMSI